ncbi:MAG: ABC transporter ATP-binding protein [Clostridiales bacterium]|nr:ABC transporter ATP-binding protein [Clostridiales bacterium]
MIKVKNVTKIFDSFTALDTLSLNVEKGSIYGLVGPNGSGKTTIMKAIAGIYKVDNGEISIDGQKSFENVDIKNRTIYISDELYFFNNFSIKQMSNFYKRVYSNWDQERFNKLKDVFNIDINRNANRLSKGMKKQVAIWLAVSAKPDVLILDEPLDGLDPVMRRKVLNILMQDVSDRNLTVMISSHNLRELEDICDHVGIINNGKLVLQRKLDDMKSETHKVQLAFKDGVFPAELEDKFNVLNKSQLGQVYSVILNGEKEKIEKEINKYKPLVFDMIPLTLEEIFIYELGGKDYEINI